MSLEPDRYRLASIFLNATILGDHKALERATETIAFMQPRDIELTLRLISSGTKIRCDNLEVNREKALQMMRVMLDRDNLSG